MSREVDIIPIKEAAVRAIRVTEFGPPEVLRSSEVPKPAAGPGQVLVAVELASVIFGDTIVRSGGYSLGLPWIPGIEVGGTVTAVGPGGDQSLLGERVVATTANNTGGYAEFAVADTGNTFRVPAGLALPDALAVFQAGAVAVGVASAMAISAGDTVFVTAAAGRIGSMLTQVCKARGATVIGGVGSRDKTAVIEELGADHAADYSVAGWTDALRADVEGLRVDVVLDSVGGTVGGDALRLLSERTGRFGLFGFSSGSWTHLDPLEVARRGLTVVGLPGLVFGAPAARQRLDAEEALQAARAGEIVPRIHAIYPLEQASKAHDDLARRRNVGAILLEP